MECVVVAVKDKISFREEPIFVSVLSGEWAMPMEEIFLSGIVIEVLTATAQPPLYAECILYDK